MQERMKNPAMLLPDAMQALQALAKATSAANAVPEKTLELGYRHHDRHLPPLPCGARPNAERS